METNSSGRDVNVIEDNGEDLALFWVFSTFSFLVSMGTVAPGARMAWFMSGEKRWRRKRTSGKLKRADWVEGRGGLVNSRGRKEKKTGNLH